MSGLSQRSYRLNKRLKGLDPENIKRLFASEIIEKFDLHKPKDNLRLAYRESKHPWWMNGHNKNKKAMNKILSVGLVEIKDYKIITEYYEKYEYNDPHFPGPDSTRTIMLPMTLETPQVLVNISLTCEESEKGSVYMNPDYEDKFIAVSDLENNQSKLESIEPINIENLQFYMTPVNLILVSKAFAEQNTKHHE